MAIPYLSVLQRITSSAAQKIGYKQRYQFIHVARHPHTGNVSEFCGHSTFLLKTHKKAYGKAGNGNEMEMKTITHQSLVQCFFS